MEIACRTSPFDSKYAQQQHRIGEIAGVDGRLHLRPDQAVMRADEERRDALLRQEHQQLVELNHEEPLLGHRVEVAVEAVDDDNLDAGRFDRFANQMRELARRQLRRVDLHEVDQPRFDVLLDVDAEAAAPCEQRIAGSRRT